MISGPVFPRNREGLAELVERHLDEIERGMVLVDRDLECGADCNVDALAMDAAGRPVFLFMAQRDTEASLPGRILTASAWLVSGVSLLRRFVPFDGLDYSQPSRMVVLGFELSAGLLEQLSQLRELGVEVYQYCSVRVGDRERGGVFPLLGGADLEGGDADQLPEGVRDPQARALGGYVLDLMRRLDPDVQVAGDRYTRTFSYGSDALAELYLRNGQLSVRVPDAPDVCSLRTQEDAQLVAEAVTRRFLEVDGVELPEVSQRRPATGGEPVDERDLSLDQIRDMADQSKLSPEEYSVLGESRSDG